MTAASWNLWDDYDVARERRRDDHHDDAQDREQIQEARAESERYADAPAVSPLLPRRGAA